MPEYKAVKRSVSFVPENLEKAQMVADQKLGGNLSRFINELIAGAQGIEQLPDPLNDYTPIRDLVARYAPAWAGRAATALDEVDEGQLLTKTLVALIEEVEAFQDKSKDARDIEGAVPWLHFERNLQHERRVAETKSRYSAKKTATQKKAQ